MQAVQTDTLDSSGQLCNIDPYAWESISTPPGDSNCLSAITLEMIGDDPSFGKYLLGTAS